MSIIVPSRHTGIGAWVSSKMYTRIKGYNYVVVVVVSHIQYGYAYSKSKDQPGKVANPARGQLNKENEYFHVPVRA